jgi:hypothetical protein
LAPGEPARRAKTSPMLPMHQPCQEGLTFLAAHPGQAPDMADAGRRVWGKTPTRARSRGLASR